MNTKKILIVALTIISIFISAQFFGCYSMLSHALDKGAVSLDESLFGRRERVSYLGITMIYTKEYIYIPNMNDQ
jgi:hypothetical protein